MSLISWRQVYLFLIPSLSASLFYYFLRCVITKTDKHGRWPFSRIVYKSWSSASSVNYFAPDQEFVKILLPRVEVWLQREMWRLCDVDSGILCGLRLNKFPLPLVIGDNVALAPFGAIMSSFDSGTHKQYSLFL